MPSLPVPPAIAASKISTYNPNKNFMLPASGPVSGTELHCSAMYIVTQQLHVDYKRVPVGMFNMFGGTGSTNQNFNLSSIAVSGGINRTMVAIEFYAVGAAYILSGNCWESSSFTQSQTFNVDSQSSLDGVSYGTVGAGCLGPAGTVFNAPSGTYYNRRPLPPGFDPAAYPEYVFSRTGFNYRMLNLSGAVSCQGPSYPNIGLDFNKSAYDFFAVQSKIPQNPSHWSLCGAQILADMPGPWAHHVGPYAAYQDSESDTISFINGLGNLIKGPGGTSQITGLVGEDNQLLYGSQYNHYLHTW